MSIIQIAVEKMQSLPPEKQQEVLDFIEFLQNKLSQHPNQEKQEPISFLTVGQNFAGCVDGASGDLATNKKYLV